MSDKEPAEYLAEHYLKDSNDRLHYQQEFSVAGFKTLILINGGAIIGLLTYAGHASGNEVASRLFAAFLCYAGGLVLAMLAYLTGYFSQANFMQNSILRAYAQLGVRALTTKTPEDYARVGYVCIAAGVLLCMASLGTFVAGSWLAMSALT